MIILIDKIKRLSEEYKSFDIMAADWKQRLYDQELRETVKFVAYMNKICNDHYIVVISIAGDYKKAQGLDQVEKQLRSLGIEMHDIKNNNVWVIQKGKILFSSDDNTTYQWHQDIGPYDSLSVQSPEGKEDMPKVILGTQEYMAVSNGINVFVYDTFTGDLVESTDFPIVKKAFVFEKPDADEDER